MYNINIIIPCYYASEIIRPCFQSLAEQTNKNFMVTIINDCSPYNQLEYKDIIEEFSQFYYIEYYKTKTNSGPGVARQLGLENNKSPFIMFIDDDDCLSKDAIKIYNSYLNENIAYIYGKRSVDNKIEDTNLTGSIFNFSVIKQLNITFKPLYYEEDSLFMEEFALKFNRLRVNSNYQIMSLSELIYLKKNNPNSLCSTYSMEKKQYYFYQLIMEICKIILDLPMDFFTKDYMLHQFNNICIYGMNLYTDIKDSKPLYDLLEKYQISEINYNYVNILPCYQNKIDTSLTISKYKEDYYNETTSICN